MTRAKKKQAMGSTIIFLLHGPIRAEGKKSRAKYETNFVFLSSHLIFVKKIGDVAEKYP